MGREMGIGCRTEFRRLGAGEMGYQQVSGVQGLRNLGSCNDILDQRRTRFPNELNTEELLMRILEEILHMYTVIAGSSRILDTLIYFNVGNRLQNIQQGSKTLD